MLLLPNSSILFICVLASLSLLFRASLNLNLSHQHPDPEAVVQEVQRRLNGSISRRQMLSQLSTGATPTSTCATGNPIDDCWRCDPNWATNRQRLADCGIGFGKDTVGGKGGQIYVVTDSSDDDVVDPRPGTLRYAVVREEPLWIIFSTHMMITLKHELIINSFKTIDGRGARVEITGHGCLTLQYVSNVIVHNVKIHHCKPSGNTNIRSSPTHVGFRGKSDGDAISISGSHGIWIDHCSLSYCTDGLIDAILGSTAITVSNCHFSHHNEVMLLGHNDKYMLDEGMQVTIAFNHFGEALVQRMPRCRRGYIHVVNNDYAHWEMYAIGGSAKPTINSQGNRYIAPEDVNSKEVTKRVETDEKEWEEWNWRTEGDLMINGAFFVPSGQGLSQEYAKASSVEPRAANYMDQITQYAGVFGESKTSSSPSVSYPSSSGGEGGTSSFSSSGGDEGSGGGDYFGMIYGSSAPAQRPMSPVRLLLLSVLTIVILILYTNIALL